MCFIVLGVFWFRCFVCFARVSGTFSGCVRGVVLGSGGCFGLLVLNVCFSLMVKCTFHFLGVFFGFWFCLF